MERMNVCRRSAEQDRKGFVCLSVCKCEILANLAARVLDPFKKGMASGARAAR